MLAIRPIAVLPVALVVALSACVSVPPPAESERGSQRTAPQSLQPSAVASSPARVTRDLAERPQIWFSPLDPSPADASRPFNGGPDFMALFEEDAPWEEAAEAIHVFKLYGGWVAGAATDAQLRQVVGDLNRRGLAIGFEASPLRYGSDCGAWLEEGDRIMRRLAAAGADVGFVALDHPYDHGVLAAGPGACALTVEEAAAGVAAYVAAIRARLPDAVVGTIETADNEAAQVQRWVEAYRSAAGEDFDFVHLDLNFARPDWPERTLEVEAYLRGAGIEFGMIYFGNEEDRSDEVWLGRTEERFTAFELLGGRPDHAIFQSWHPYPQRILPETDPHAFTAVVHRYLRARTALTVGIDGGDLVSGVLTTADGAPIAGADVSVAVVAGAVDGVWHEFTITGTVPRSAALADVGYRVNTECACSGPASFTLAAVRYGEGAFIETGEPADVPIAGAELASGSAHWALWGAAPHHVDAEGLHVEAGAGQDAAANSARFAVSGGAPFVATFVARVAPASLGSGYFSIIFSDGQSEVTRFMVPLAAAVLPIGTTTTAADGFYALGIGADGVPSGILRGTFGGTSASWPARAEVPLTEGP